MLVREGNEGGGGLGITTGTWSKKIKGSWMTEPTALLEVGVAVVAIRDVCVPGVEGACMEPQFPVFPRRLVQTGVDWGIPPAFLQIMLKYWRIPHPVPSPVAPSPLFCRVGTRR